MIFIHQYTENYGSVHLLFGADESPNNPDWNNMTHIIADRVKETTSTIGTGDFLLTGALLGFHTFDSALTADNDTTWYCAENGAEWEVGLVTRLSSSSLSRTTVFASSNSNMVVDFTTAPSIFITIPSAGINSLKDRANHTGVQDINTITGLQSKLDLINQRRIQSVVAATGAVTCDWSLYDEIRLTLIGDVILTFSGANDGQGCTLKLTQGSTGSHGVTIDSSVRFNADVVEYTPTITAGKSDRLGFIHDTPDGKYDFVSIIKGF